MRIVVTTPTGHIGSKLTNILLNRGAEVTLIARHPDKVTNFKSRGARIVAGEHDDPKVLEQALEGADALFWLTPPNETSHDPIGDAKRFAEAGAQVIAKRPELHVVQLSSGGAHLASGTGPIVGLHYTEERFRAVGKNVVSLRANLFMENILSSIPTIQADGSIYSMVPGSITAPQVATQDIAQAAADQLLSPRNGHHIVDVVGPRDISFDQVAAILSNTVGKTVKVVTIPPPALKQGLIQAGISPEMADLFVEMENALENGLSHQFHGEQKIIGKVTYEQFAKDVFLPAYRQAGKLAKAS